MRLSYDPTKNERNIADRGISFEQTAMLDWATALITGDRRKPYPERRFQVLGWIGEHLHMLVFTPRPGTVHVISLRRANRRERSRYDQAQAAARDAGR
jgi:uncharacterized protein